MVQLDVTGGRRGPAELSLLNLPSTKTALGKAEWDQCIPICTPPLALPHSPHTLSSHQECLNIKLQ